LLRRYINGVAIGRGRCVVDDDGLVVPVSKCTVKELRAEAEARGAANAAEMKRPELTAYIKVGWRMRGVHDCLDVWHLHSGSCTKTVLFVCFNFALHTALCKCVHLPV
jgi:hypothetical protein